MPGDDLIRLRETIDARTEELAAIEREVSDTGSLITSIHLDLLNASGAERTREASRLAEAEEAYIDAGKRLHEALREHQVLEELIHIDPDDLLAEVEPDFPILLLPVRLETRFVRKAGAVDLLVRVYPDAIHQYMHEAELTAEEQNAGVAYWESVKSATEDEKQLAWATLVARYGAPRAAYVRRSCELDTPVSLKPAPWTKAATTDVLPDRWIFLGRRGGGSAFDPVIGNPIPDVLPTGPDPNVNTEIVDPGVEWMVDFDAAVSVGMAARIPLGPRGTQGLDRLLVVGVKATIDPDVSAHRLGRLLDGHHYAQGLALPEHDTPTNSSPGAPSGWSRREPVGAGLSYGVECGPPATVPSNNTSEERARVAATDGGRIAAALGIPAERFAYIAGAGAVNEIDARAMTAALWPATWGYYLRQMFSETVRPEVVERVRRHYVDNVRSAGPLPLMQVGTQPYGVLPVTSLGRYKSSASSAPGEATAVELLKRWRNVWSEGASKLPRVGRGKDPEASIVEILSMTAWSSAYKLRWMYDMSLINTMGHLTGVGEGKVAGLISVQNAIADVGSRLLMGGPGVTGDQIRNTLSSLKTALANLPLVQDGPLSITEVLDPNYLDFLRTATVQELKDNESSFGEPLLYLLLRHSLVLAYVGAGVEQVVGDGGSTMQDLLDRTIQIEVPEGVRREDLLGSLDMGSQPRPRPPYGEPRTIDLGVDSDVFEFLEAELSVRGGTRTMEEVIFKSMEDVSSSVHMFAGGIGAASETGGIQSPDNAPPIYDRAITSEVRLERVEETRNIGPPPPPPAPPPDATLPASEALTDLVAGLEHLQTLPSARLDQLMRRTLDTCSHRLDAWITSLATKRLNDLRRADPARTSAGIHLGGFGWVENLRLDPAPKVVPEPDHAGIKGPLVRREDNAGFIHAPSLTHAATAAVLRSAHLSHGRGEAFAIDLTSTRARLAAWMMEGMRQGQSLGALLGYRLERALHDDNMDACIARLRDAAPLARTHDVAPDDPSEIIAPHDVVDGQLLLERLGAQPAKIDLGAIASASHVDREKLKAHILDMAAAADAVSDALMAEAVFHSVQGNSARAAAAVSVAAGESPPLDELEILRTPRTAVAAAHRVLLLHAGAGSPAAKAKGWPTTTNEVRAVAEPMLNAWAGHLFGPATRVICTVRFLDSSTGTPLPGTLGAPMRFTLDSLKLSPLDVLAAMPAAEQGGRSDIEALIANHVLSPERRPKDVPADARVETATGRGPLVGTKDISLDELMEVARSARALIALARPVTSIDLAPPGAATEQKTNLTDLRGRVDAAIVRARTAEGRIVKLLKRSDEKVDLVGLRRALVDCSYAGVSGAVPVNADGDDEVSRRVLVGQGRSVAAQLTAGLAKADELKENAEKVEDSDEEVEIQIHRLEAVLGEGFTLVPRLLADATAAVRTSLAKPPWLSTPDLTTTERASAIRSFMSGAARVRRPVAVLEETLLLAQALGAVHPGPRVAQLSADPSATLDEQWIGTAAPPLGGRLSLVVLDAGAREGASIAGLVIDDWVELVPGTRETTGVAFHYDAPGSEAPQSLLLAVPPEVGKPWNVATLEDILHDTLDLAAQRMVDLSALPAFEHELPALLFAVTDPGRHYGMTLGQFLGRHN